jgi:hypothetical protein
MHDPVFVHKILMNPISNMLNVMDIVYDTKVPTQNILSDRNHS